jgi:hypothetical protein
LRSYPDAPPDASIASSSDLPADLPKTDR